MSITKKISEVYKNGPPYSFLFLLCVFSFFIALSLLFPFVMEKDDKMLKKVVSTREWHLKHMFAGQKHNISGINLVEKLVNGTISR